MSASPLHIRYDMTVRRGFIGWWVISHLQADGGLPSLYRRTWRPRKWWSYNAAVRWASKPAAGHTLDGRVEYL